MKKANYYYQYNEHRFRPTTNTNYLNNRSVDYVMKSYEAELLPVKENETYDEDIRIERIINILLNESSSN